MFDKIREVEVGDDEAKQILESTRHRQIQQSFTKLTEAVIASNGDDKLLAAAEKQTFAIELFAEAIKQIELNPTEIVSSLFKIREDIIASNNHLIETINTRLLPDTFTLKRYGVAGGGAGTESVVKVNYKPANKINLKP